MVLLDLDGKDKNDSENAMIIEASAGTTLHSFKSSFEQLLGVGNNAERKGSKALNVIDGLQNRDAIPEEM